jgi:hypothetical protein
MKNNLLIEDTKAYVYARDRGRCRNCGKPVPWPGQSAHCIPQSRAMLKKYGARVIHHPLNQKLVCGLACNDAVSISNHPVKERELVILIQEDLEK